MERSCRTFGCQGRLSAQVPERVVLCSNCQAIFGNDNIRGLKCLITTCDTFKPIDLINLSDLFHLLQKRNCESLAQWLLLKIGSWVPVWDCPAENGPLFVHRTDDPVPFVIRINTIWYRHGDLDEKVAAFRRNIEGLTLVPVPVITKALGVNYQLLKHAIRAGKLQAIVVGDGHNRRYYMTPFDAENVFWKIVNCQTRTPSHRQKLRVFPSPTFVSGGRRPEGPATLDGLYDWLRSQSEVSVHITARCLGIDPRRIVRAIAQGKLDGTCIRPRGAQCRYYQSPEQVRATIAMYSACPARRVTNQGIPL